MAITFKIGFQVQDKELQSSLKALQNDIQNAFNIRGFSLTPEIQNATKEAMALEKALKRATTDKGISYYSLTSELRKAGTSASQLTSTLTKGGSQFAASLSVANNALALSNRNVISLNNKIKEMSRVLTQSFKFTAAQSALQAVSNAAQQAFQWVEELNKTITDISVVTGYQGEQLERVTKNAIQGAKELRIAANDYAQGALIFYQQGLNDEEVARRTEITVKAARAAGASMSEMSSQLTAVWNTYQMAGNEMQRAASVGAKMAADTAVDFSDIAEAMQTAAAPAEQMGVSYNSLAAIIATVGDTTQQSASVIGNAFKTIFSRFQQLKSSGTDGEITLNRVSTQLQELGVSVLDAEGELRNLDSVIMEVGNQWDSWSSKQQLAIAQLVGGTRQYGQFLSLMNNFDKYQDLLSSANAEDGTALEQQYSSSLESIESYAENAGEAWNRAFSNLIDEDALKTVYKTVETIGNAVDTVLESLGGAPGLLLTISTLLSSKIVPTLMKAGTNAKVFVRNLTPEGRRKGIEQDFNNQSSAIDAEISKTTDKSQIASLNIEKAKIEYSRQTAIINDEINTKLQTASGAYKLNLEYQQQQLQVSQQLYQSKLDELSILEKEAQKENEILQTKRNNGGFDSDIETAKRDADAAEAAKLVQGEELERLKQEKASKEEIAQAQTKYNQLLHEAELAQQRYNKAVDQAKADPIIRLNNTLTQTLSGLERGDKDFTQLAQRLKEAGANANQVDNALNELAQGNRGPINDLVKELTKTKLELDGVAQAAQRADSALNLGEDISAAKRNQKNIKDNIQNPQQPQQVNTINYAEIANGLVQVAMSASMTTMALTNLFSVLNNDQMSFGEKILALLPIIAQLVIGVQQMISAMTIIGGIMKTSIANSAALAAARQAEAIATEKLAAAEAKLAAAKQAGASKSVIGGLTSARNKAQRQAEAASAQVQELSQGTIAGKLSGSLKNLGKNLKSLPSAATQGAKAFGKLALSFAKAHPVALAVVAGVAAVTTAIIYAYNEWKNVQPEAQLKKAEEAAQGLAEGAAQAKEEADSLRSAIESYDSAISKLEECERGTQEWDDALKSANQSALDLINTMANANIDISGLYERNEDGLIAINSARLQEAQDQLDNQSAIAQFTSSAGQARVNEARRNVEGREIARDMTGISSDFWSGGLNEQYQKALDANLEELVDAEGPEEFKQALLEAGIIVRDFSNNNIQQLQNAVNEYAATLGNASEQLESAAKITVDSMIGDDYNEEVKDLLGESVARKQEKLDDMYLAAFDSFAKADPFEESNPLYNDMIQAYRDYMGDQSIEAADNFSRGTDTNRTFGFMIDGELKEVRAEEMASIMASQKALEGLSTSAENLNNVLIKLGRTAEGENIKNVMTEGNMNTATSGELIQNFDGGIMQDYFGAEMGAGFFETWDYLKQAFGSTAEISKAAKEMGMGLFEFIRYIQDGVNASIDTMQELGKGMGDSLSGIWEDLAPDLENVDIGGQEKIADLLKDTFEISGTSGATALTDLLKEAGDDAGKVAEILSGIDWTQNGAMNEVNDLLKEQGIYLNTGSEAWITYISQAKEAARATQDVSEQLENFKQQLSDFKSILSEVEFGSVISDEDYQKLIEYDKTFADFFVQTTDGWKMISKDVDGFNAKARGTVGSLDEMKEKMAGLQNVGQFMDFEEDSSSRGNYFDRYDREGNLRDTATLAENALKITGTTSFDAAFAYFGISKEALDEAAQYVLNKQNELAEGTISEEDLADDAVYQEHLALMERYYTEVENMGQQYSAGMFEDTNAEEIWVDAMVSSINELNGALASGAISAETYEKTFDSIIQKQAEMYDLDYDDIVDQAENLADAYELTEEAATELAIQNQRMNKGLKILNENWEDWSKTLKKGDKTTTDYIDTMQEVEDVIADLVGASEDLDLSQEFFDSAENLELIGKAAEGDEKAINELGVAVAQDLVSNIEGLTENASITFPDGAVQIISPDAFEQARSTVLTGLANLRTAVANGAIGIGDPINNEVAGMGIDWVNGLNDMALATGMSVEQMNSLLSSMGVQTEVTTVPVEQEVQVPVYRTYTNIVAEGDPETGDGRIVDTYTNQVDTKTMTGVVDVAQINTGEDGNTMPTIRYIGSGSVSPSSIGGDTPSGGGNSGGGGSKFKPEEHVDEQDKVHKRYENLTEALEDMTRQLSRFSDAADDAWGAARIRQLRGYNAQIQQIARTQKQLIEETKEYYQIDKNTLMADANIASIALWNPGEYGSLANPEDIRRWIDEEIAAATAGINAEIDAYNARGVDDQDALDKAKEPYEDRIEYLEGLNEDLDQMLETTDLLQDRLDEQMQNIYDWMANKVEEMEYKLEFKLRIDESDFDRLENLLDRLGDTGIILGDSFETLSDMMSNIMTEQAPAVFEAIDRGWQIANNIVTPENQDYFEGLFGPEVWQEYLDNNGGLPAEIMEFLQDQKDALYDMIDQVVDLALEQLDAIFTKMEQWFEKYARLTDQLDVAVTKMDTLQEILDFKGTNYLTEGGRQVQRRLNEERMNAAGTQAKIAKSQLEQAKQWAATVEAEYNTMKEAYDNASDEEKSALAGGVNELYQQMIEAQEQVTDFEGEFAESISEIFSTAQDVLEQEKEMAKANISATIGGLFSDIDEMMNMYSAVDSWSNTHLDDYDKNYLLGDLQSQFDEATENINVDSYEGLAQWQEQLNKYKEDGRDVTQEEVDLLQKALDLEIARANFEDAQNAKNTMRLARDASGNWSYIYSQDQTSSNQADEIARLEYEYKKAYEEMQDSFGENIMDMAGQMKNVIENINYQLYFSSEQYRKMIDTQLDMLSQQMIASGATIEQVTSIMGTGIKNWQYDFSQSAAGIVTDTQTMEEMIDKFLVALVGTSEGYIPGNTSSGGFYGDWMTAQKDVAQVVNEKGDEIGEKFGLIQDDIGGYIDEIVAGEQGSLHYLKIETQTTQEFMDTYLGYMENDWSDTEDYLMGQIGEKGDTQQGTITGDIHQIDQAAEEMRNDTLGEFDGLLTGLQNWGVNFRSEVQTWIDKLEEYINKIKEAEIASEKKMDEPYVDEEANKVETQEPAKPSAPSNTEDSSTAKAAAAYENAMEIYDKINRGLYPNGGANRRAKALSEGYTETEYEIAQELINKVYPIAKRGQGIKWDTAVAQIKAKYFASGGLADYTGPAWLDGSYSKPELVLNPEDTQNILSTVKLMREAVAQKIAALNGRNISGAELKSFADRAQTIEQQVHIEASFPNVSVAAEIEQAFNDLINQVAQYNIKK